MLKYVIYTLIIVALLGIGFYFAVKLPVQITQGSITYSITGCLDRMDSLEMKLIDTVNFSLEGNTIIIMHSLFHNCCENIAMDQKIEGDVITITENLHGDLCYCTCHSDITAKIGSLEKKKYTVNLYKNEGAPVLVASREMDLS